MMTFHYNDNSRKGDYAKVSIIEVIILRIVFIIDEGEIGFKWSSVYASGVWVDGGTPQRG